MDLEKLKKRIRNVPDFPKKGIVFRDITTLIKDGESLKHIVSIMKEKCEEKHADVIVGIESRGFILGSIVAHELGIGFVPIRKKGKLPAEVVTAGYEKEYGKDYIEVHKDGIMKDQNVMIVDDLLATGGTAEAAARLVEMTGGKVAGFVFLIELSFLKGRDKIKNYDIFSLIQYDSE